MAELLLVNPKRRTRRRRPTRARKRVTRRTVTRRAPRRRVRRRRNPSANTFGVPTYGSRRRNPARRRAKGDIVNRIVMPSVMGATGALALDIAWGYLPIPMNLKTGMLRHVVKGAGAIALGYLTEMVATKATAEQMTRGAMTVVVHGAMRELAQQFMPQVPLDGMGYYSAGTPVGVGAYVGGMGAYIGSEGAANPYLAADTLNQPFAGPSAAQMARAQGERSCLESENNMGQYY